MKALAGGGVAAVGAEGGFFLKDFTDLLGHEAGAFAGDLAAQEIGGEVEESVGLVPAILFAHLFEGLDAEKNADFMLPASRQSSIHAKGMEAWEFVDIDMAGYAALTINDLEHTADQKADHGAVNVLFLRVGAETKDLWCGRIINIQPEVAGRKEIIKPG